MKTVRVVPVDLVYVDRKAFDFNGGADPADDDGDDDGDHENENGDDVGGGGDGWGSAESISSIRASCPETKKPRKAL